MRVFIALDLPQEIKKEIKKIQGLLKKKNLFTGKFTKVENLHLTLKFLGEIDEEKIEKIKEKLREIQKESFESFDAYIEEIGVFSKNFVKIIWVKLDGKQVFELQKKIDEKLKEMFEPEKRFMSHVTIVRVKHVSDKKTLLEYLRDIKLSKLKMKVDSFYLMKSELFPEGPVYEEIEKYNLKS